MTILVTCKKFNGLFFKRYWKMYSENVVEKHDRESCCGSERRSLSTFG